MMHERDNDPELLIRYARRDGEAREAERAIGLVAEDEHDRVTIGGDRVRRERELGRQNECDLVTSPGRERDASREARLTGEAGSNGVHVDRGAGERAPSEKRLHGERRTIARVAATADPLLIYGATGYSGRLIVEAARSVGLHPILAGRDAGKLAALATPLGLEWRAAPLGEPARIDATLRDVRVVLHAAGPFSHTARPMLEACLRAGVHYLDISGEIAVIEALARRDASARQRGIMVMPAVGFDVVPSDCLAAHVARRVPGAERLALGLTGFSFLTRGSAKTLVEAVDAGVGRRGGAITRLPLGSRHRGFDYGDGPRPSLNVSWGDVATAYYTTDIPNIETYVEATPLVQGTLAGARYLGWLLRMAPWQAVMRAATDLLPEGPGDAERVAARMTIVAEAEDGAGRRARARLVTPESYSFTGVTAAAIASRALAGDVEPGFQTPARVYGSDFVLGFAGVVREDLE